MNDINFQSVLERLSAHAAIKREAAAYLDMPAEEIRWLCILENLRAAAELAACARPKPGAVRFINTREVPLEVIQSGRDHMGVLPK